MLGLQVESATPCAFGNSRAGGKMMGGLLGFSQMQRVKL